jgi:serine/threonine-protein kinase HipA
MKRCLICKKELIENGDYHSRCSKNFFDSKETPVLEYNLEEIGDLAKDLILGSKSVTGVQKKLSVHLSDVRDNGVRKMTIVGLWGAFILKPPSDEYAFLPENEDLTMDLAEFFNIKVVPHGLIRFSSGEFAYITKRIDRVKKEKIHMEDMCQLQERLTEYKYQGSVEQISKTIDKFSTNPGFDKQRLFEIVLFSHLIGNSDMHLKNYSLIHNQNGAIELSSAYDLVNVKIVEPKDLEESALTINGKKNRLKRADFDLLANYLKIPLKATNAIYDRFENKILSSENIIRNSFLPEEYQEKYLNYLLTKQDEIFKG